MNIRQTLTEIFAAAFEQCGYDPALGAVVKSNRPDLCQYQCNGAMAGAKQYKKAPQIIAGQVAEQVAGDKRFAVTVVNPGFLNITLSDGYLAGQVGAMGGDSRLLLPKMEPRTIVVDYGGPNLAKPLHVGHLRSGILGDTLCRLARFLGHNVISDTHLGDWGLQMGLVICEIRNRMPDLPYFDPDFQGEYPDHGPVTVDELNEIYPTASARSKEDKEFAAQAAQATVDLQGGRRGYRALWEHIRRESVEDMKGSYRALNVSFDHWLGESDASPYIPQVMERLKERNLLRESNGAMVVDVSLPEDKEPMPPILLVKSDGGDIYGTTDLGTLLQRVTDWKPDKVWYIVDNRQTLHFKQVFRCAELAGIISRSACTHLPFGTVNGLDGKPFKTRAGGVMRLSELIGMAVDNAREKVRDSQAAVPEADQDRVAQAIGVAAIKVGDMINHPAKDYIFDMQRFLASDGKTGPYLQYAAVRIQSVLDKAAAAGDASGPLLPPASEVERDLLLALVSVPDSLLRAFEDMAPNVICEALFDVAGVFNRFYFENRILTCPDPERKASWLTLLDITGRMIRQLLDLLGIDVPEYM